MRLYYYCCQPCSDEFNQHTCYIQTDCRIRRIYHDASTACDAPTSVEQHTTCSLPRIHQHKSRANQLHATKSVDLQQMTSDRPRFAADYSVTGQGGGGLGGKRTYRSIINSVGNFGENGLKIFSWLQHFVRYFIGDMPDVSALHHHKAQVYTCRGVNFLVLLLLLLFLALVTTMHRYISHKTSN